jgi:hypothetical protein
VWKALVVVLLCVFSTASVTATPPSNGVTKEEWNYLCSQLKGLGYDRVNCRKIDKPVVILTKAVLDLAPPGWELYGLVYDGEPYILINPTLDPVWTRTVVVHETVHYVLWAFYGSAVSDCQSEKVARIVHHNWERTLYDDSWTKGYGC